MKKPLLSVRGLTKNYIVGGWRGRRTLQALRGVDFAVQPGETLALVGESGCGKSTLAKVLMGIEPATDGEIVLQGKGMNAWDLNAYRRQVQMIFQDPLSSLNPRKKVVDLIAEPLVIQGQLSRDDIYIRVKELMAQVGLREDWSDRYPHMLSGGQRQRVGIARALTLSPKLLICDEPVSALDVSLQAQVLNLLLELQEKLGLSYLFISHDLAVVSHLAHRIMVMYLGQIVEVGSRDQIVRKPKHPYTQALLESFPKLDRMEPPRSVLNGELPSPLQEIEGCSFASRCPKVADICRAQAPMATMIGEATVKCHFAVST